MAHQFSPFSQSPFEKKAPPKQTTPYEHQEYPMVMYHAVHAPNGRRFLTEADAQTAGEGWSPTPLPEAAPVKPIDPLADAAEKQADALEKQADRFNDSWKRLTSEHEDLGKRHEALILNHQELVLEADTLRTSNQKLKAANEALAAQLAELAKKPEAPAADSKVDSKAAAPKK